MSNKAMIAMSEQLERHAEGALIDSQNMYTTVKTI